MRTTLPRYWKARIVKEQKEIKRDRESEGDREREGERERKEKQNQKKNKEIINTVDIATDNEWASKKKDKKELSNLD